MISLAASMRTFLATTRVHPEVMLEVHPEWEVILEVMLEVMPLDPEVILEVMLEVMPPEPTLKVLMIVMPTSNWLNIGR